MKPDAILGYEYKQFLLSRRSLPLHTSKNVLIIGTAGTGKSRNYVRNQLFQFYGNYVVIDSKNVMYDEFSEIFKDKGWNVSVIDLVDEIAPQRNTFKQTYFRTEKSILFINIPFTGEMEEISLYVSQLCSAIQDDESGELPVHFIFDDFQLLNVSNLPKLLMKSSKTNTQFSVIVQKICQAEELYDKTWKDTIKFFDSILVYGSVDRIASELLCCLANEWHPNPIIQCTYKKKRIFYHSIVHSELPLCSEMFMRMPPNDVILMSKGEDKIKLIQKTSTAINAKEYENVIFSS